MLYGIWGGVAIVAGILAAIGALLVWLMGPVGAMSVGFFVICLLMILIILAQKPRGGGLSGAFGGAGGASTQTAFGAKTGDVMTWATIVLFALFIGTAMGLTWATLPDTEPATPALPVDASDATDAAAADAASETVNQAVDAGAASVPSETSSATPATPVVPATSTESQP